jgi:hypothetical protein
MFKLAPVAFASPTTTPKMAETAGARCSTA